MVRLVRFCGRGFSTARVCLPKPNGLWLDRLQKPRPEGRTDVVSRPGNGTALRKPQHPPEACHQHARPRSHPAGRRGCAKLRATGDVRDGRQPRCTSQSSAHQHRYCHATRSHHKGASWAASYVNGDGDIHRTAALTQVHVPTSPHAFSLAMRTAGWTGKFHGKSFPRKPEAQGNPACLADAPSARTPAYPIVII